eukprot:CCRYP_012179-RA/>CCRYP_012179-RA protein AED:0.10 eAED:0.28 QI:0/0/0/1/1/1/2/0/63
MATNGSCATEIIILCDVGATKGKTAVEVAPVVIRIMASILVPSILQSDNGGEFLGKTLRAVNQ